MFKFLKYLIFITIIINLHNCTVFKKSQDEKGEEAPKTKRINPNANERAKEARDKGLILFGKKVGENNQVVSFANSNVLWRASLEVLNFLPLESVDYAGGIISTDWYKKNINDNEEIKIRVEFKSNELSPSSINIISHKRICQKDSGCNIVKTSKTINQKIKNSIINKAREIKIADDEKVKK